MDQPQPCTKCNTLPEDILMLACSHDLCLNCAAQRLNFQMKKKKPANSIVCEFCYERTPLDSQSIAELQKLIPAAQRNAGRSYVNENKPNDNSRYQRFYEKSSRANDQHDFRQRERQRQKSYEKPLYQRSNQVRQRTNDVRQPTKNYPVANNQSLSGVTARKNCNEHPEEDILYFCFTCKCECICPQCVIHGKHKDHDVKTIRKSHPLIKNELESNLDRIESNIQNLLIRKSQVQKNIRALNEQNSQSKRQIQQAFDQIRAKIDAQERQLLSRCDSQLNEAIVQLQKSTKDVIRRIDELKMYSVTTIDYLKKDQQTMLNYYAKKWKDLDEECKEPIINISTVTLPNNEKTLGAIFDVAEQVQKIGGGGPIRR